MKWYSCYRLVTVFGCLVLVGCTDAKISSPKEAFFTRHPELKDKYVEFSETSVGAVQACFDDIYQAKMTLMKGIQKSLKTGVSPDDYFKGLEARIRENHESKVNFLQTIKRDFDSEKENIFYYSYKDDRGEEQGWAIVRDGRIRKKYPIGSSLGTGGME